MTDKSVSRVALFVSTITSFITPFMGSAVNVALPAIGREFRMGPVALGWIPTIFLLSGSMFLVPFGRIADITGRKRVFLWGIILFSLASALCALAQTETALIAFRFLQGIGGAMIFGTGTAILISCYPPEKRGAVLGVNVAGVYIGLSIGPFVGGLLTHYFGWRSIFLAVVPLGVVAVAAVLWKIKDEWSSREESFDAWGALLYAASLVTLMYGLSLLPHGSALVPLLLGTLLLVAFGAREMEIKEPLVDLRLFRENRSFTFSNLAALINYSATFAVSFLLSLYLQYVKGFSVRTVGIILVSQPIIQALFSPLAGRLSDRIEPRLLASMGMGITALGLCSFIFLSPDSGLLYIVANLVLLGFGFALFSSPNVNAVMSSVDKRLYGVASGTLGTMRLVGQMLSMGITLAVFSAFMKDGAVSSATYRLLVDSARVTFAIMALLCLGGVFASLSRGSIHPETGK
ncbi:MAG: MFS transporter [Smithellaceae bacterium]|nr:MFS transporter [Smithellaceae bacterium]